MEAAQNNIHAALDDKGRFSAGVLHTTLGRYIPPKFQRNDCGANPTILETTVTHDARYAAASARHRGPFPWLYGDVITISSTNCVPITRARFIDPALHVRRESERVHPQIPRTNRTFPRDARADAAASRAPVLPAPTISTLRLSDATVVPVTTAAGLAENKGLFLKTDLLHTDASEDTFVHQDQEINGLSKIC